MIASPLLACLGTTGVREWSEILLFPCRASIKTSDQDEHCCQSLQPVPPLLSCLPVCLHPFWAKPAHTPPPPHPAMDTLVLLRLKGRRTGHQPWELAPKFWISSGSGCGQCGWVWCKHHRQRKALLGKSCTILPQYPWPCWGSSQWSQLGCLCRTSHPMVAGNLNRILRFSNKYKEGPSELGKGKIAFACIVSASGELETIGSTLPPLVWPIFTKCTVTKSNLPLGNLQVTILGFLKVATLKLWPVSSLGHVTLPLNYFLLHDLKPSSAEFSSTAHALHQVIAFLC